MCDVALPFSSCLFGVCCVGRRVDRQPDGAAKEDAPNRRRARAPPTTMSGAETETYCRALEDYTARNEEQLTVQKGDIFRSLGEQNNDWIKVLFGNQIGWLPLSICEQLEGDGECQLDDE